MIVTLSDGRCRLLTVWFQNFLALVARVFSNAIALGAVVDKTKKIKKIIFGIGTPTYTYKDFLCF